MNTTPRIEYEVQSSEVFAEEHLGMVVLEIASSQGEKVAIVMRRSVFETLADQIQKAKAGFDKHPK
jgi:hypothetical protein